jgi:hypothetical protein
MKKRMLAALLAVCMLCFVLVLPASAAGDAALQTVQALGIVTAQEDGSMNLTATVTRAQFAEMLAAVSGQKDAASTTQGSLFSDVRSGYWASAYIRLAVKEGWMNGYSDGSFRPDRTITLEEACTACLRVLGYDTAKLTGAFPAAQLNKAKEIGLLDGIDLTQGQSMTRAACVQLFYNLLLASTSSGGTYATTLGYTVTGGEVDYTAALLDGLSGPYIAQINNAALPFTPTIIYRDGKRVASAALQKYDVYYYNQARGTVWIYTKRIAGKVTLLSPDAKAPTSVTVAGNTYTIGAANAVYQLSILSGGGVGSVVTLLLGMDDQVVGVLTESQVATTYYGVVQEAEHALSTTEGTTVLQSMNVLCTDGLVHTFEVDKSLLYPEGWLVEVTVTEQGIAVKALTNTLTGTTLSGKVDSGAASLGGYAFADNIKILDTTSEGGAVVIQPSRLAGCTLSVSDVRFYALDKNGKIEHLILNDATGDAWTYGYLTGVQKVSSTAATGSGSTTLNAANLIQDIVDSVIHGRILQDIWSTVVSGTSDLFSRVLSVVASNTSGIAGDVIGVLASDTQYTFVTDGKPMTVTASVTYPVIAGGIAVRYTSTGAVKAMLQTTPVIVEKLGANTVSSSDATYTLADNVQVYLYKYGEYYPVSITDLNVQNYILTAWYDDFGCAAGGRVRIVVAVERE